jgi:hypothetical protein
MQLNRQIFVTLHLAMFMLLLAERAVAGGVDMNVNQSAEWCKTLNRNASTDPDATYFNPAGTAFMRQGVYTSLNDQVIYQPIKVVSGRSAALGLSRRSYPGEEHAWYSLNGYLALKYGRLALSGCGLGFGSDGERVFKQGLQELDVLAGAPYGYGGAVNGLFNASGAPGPVGSPTSLAVSEFSGSYSIYAVQANAAYEVIKDVLAVSLGIRFYLGEAVYDARLLAPGPGAGYGGYIPGGSDMHSRRQGFSQGVVAGVSARPVEGLILGFKGEWNAPFRLDAKTHDDLVFMLVDSGFKNNHRWEEQLPAVAAFGASYATAGVRTSLSFAYFFNQFAHMRGREKHYTGGVDAGIGLDYTFDRVPLDVGTGFLWRSSGAGPGARSQLDDALDSFSVSIGFTLTIAGTTQLTVAEVFSYFIPANVNKGALNVLRFIPARVYRQGYTTAIGLTSRYSIKDKS